MHRFWLFMLLLLPFAVSAAPDLAQKQQEVEKVVKNITNAIGDFSKPLPVVKVNPGRSSQVAYIQKDPASNAFTINVDETLVDLCMEYGAKTDDAIAAVLGHELAHYYNNHHFSEDFVSFFAFGDTKTKMKQADATLEQLTVYETQADFYGSMYGFMAGYNTLDMIPPLYDKIYKAYGLPDQMDKYPSKEERKQIAVKNGLKVKHLLYVFQVATNCVLIGKYEEAAKCYNYITEEGFVTRDILNDLGVAYALRGMQLKGREAEPFAYPFELDAHSRLQAGTKGVNDDPLTFLNLAKDNFEKAATLDPDYATAEVNEACIWSVLGDLDEAEYHANKAEKKAAKTGDQPQSITNAYVIHAIIAKKQGKTDDANNWLTKAGDNYFAKINADLFAGDVANWQTVKYTTSLSPAATQADFQSTLKREEVDGVDIFSQQVEANDSVQFNIGATKQNLPDLRTIDIMHLDQSDIIYMQVPHPMIKTKSNWLIFQQTKDNCTQPTANGIKVGDDLSKVEQVYGPAENAVAARQGTYLYYSKTNIIFFLDDKNKVQNWTLYWEIPQ